MALDTPDHDGPNEIDLIMASLRVDTADVATFVEALAVKLEDAIPDSVRVYRWRERLLGPKFVGKITVDAGDRQLELRRTGSSIQTSCSRTSGGIVLKSEQVSTDEWLTALGEALAEQARRSQATRQALERLLNG
jgi:hypothetical protein